MGDLFHPYTPLEHIEAVLELVRACPQHVFQFLTKNPKRLLDFNPWPDNCWVGVTVTNQDDTEQRIPDLLCVDVAVRFLSIEPMLGSVDLEIPYGQGVGDLVLETSLGRSHLDWLIIGAMTGPGSKKYQPRPEWVQSLIEQGQAAGVPALLKNNLNWPEKIEEWPDADQEMAGKQAGLG